MCQYLTSIKEEGTNIGMAMDAYGAYGQMVFTMGEGLNTEGVAGYLLDNSDINHYVDDNEATWCGCQVGECVRLADETNWDDAEPDEAMCGLYLGWGEDLEPGMDEMAPYLADPSVQLLSLPPRYAQTKMADGFVAPQMPVFHFGKKQHCHGMTFGGAPSTPWYQKRQPKQPPKNPMGEMVRKAYDAARQAA